MTFFCFCRKKHIVFSHNSFFYCKFVAKTYCVNVHKCTEHLQAVCSHTNTETQYAHYYINVRAKHGKGSRPLGVFTRQRHTAYN